MDSACNESGGRDGNHSSAVSPVFLGTRDSCEQREEHQRAAASSLGLPTAPFPLASGARCALVSY